MDTKHDQVPKWTTADVTNVAASKKARAAFPRRCLFSLVSLFLRDLSDAPDLVRRCTAAAIVVTQAQGSCSIEQSLLHLFQV